MAVTWDKREFLRVEMHGGSGWEWLRNPVCNWAPEQGEGGKCKRDDLRAGKVSRNQKGKKNLIIHIKKK